MKQTIAYLGPVGTYSELAAWGYVRQFCNGLPDLVPYPTIPQAIQAVVKGKQSLAIVPAENSIQGSVTMTLDTVWQYEGLQIQQALVLPIENALLSNCQDLTKISAVYSHPQPLAQCQSWLDLNLPQAQQIATNSTIEGVMAAKENNECAAIASPRAAKMYQLPILASPINDHPDNCTRFWVLTMTELTMLETPTAPKTHTSIAFSLKKNMPGSLVKPLAVFADREINLSRIESRPTKVSLGDYIFFADAEASLTEPRMQEAIAALGDVTEKLRVLGSYGITAIAD
jgi:prephenate dehydratase